MTCTSNMYDLHTLPLVVGRAPLLPAQVALDVMAAPDPLFRTRETYADNPCARQAVAAASPSLARAIEEWIADKPLRNKKTPLRALAYLLRMSTRPTPFGLCAGIGEVALGEHTDLRIDDATEARRSFTRPDMQLLAKLAIAVEESDRRGAVRYSVNPCVLERGDRLYVQNVTLTNAGESGGLRLTQQRAVSLKNTDAVAFVRAMSRDLVPYETIVSALCERFGASQTEAATLADRLIEAGVLISELRPSPLGDPVAYLVDRLASLGSPCAAGLRAALSAISELDEVPLQLRAPRDYACVQSHFEAFVKDAPSNVLQIDLRVPFEGTLANDILLEVEQLADIYVRLGPIGSFSVLRERFLERYEGYERMVPLLELVDENVGLGVPDLLRSQRADAPARDALLLRLACDAERRAAEEIVLDDHMLDLIAPPVPDGRPIVPSLSVGFQIAARSERDVDNGNYLIVPSGFALSEAAGKSTGRFAAVLGERFLSHARELAKRTVDPSALTAEFAFTPSDARALNVSTRPLLYDFEVRAGVGAPAQGESIGPADLWVGIERGRFFLWSKSRGRRVEIRETHAFATAFQAPDLCRFLSLLLRDGVKRPSEFDWGAASGLTYLPRVRIGRIVLSPRRWQFAREEFELEHVRALWRLPRYVYLCDEDRRLLVDLDSPVAQALVLDQVPEYAGVILTEALPAPDELWLRSSSGAHVVEFVADGICVRTNPSLSGRAPKIGGARPAYGPASEWIYAKLYAGSHAVTDLLTKKIAPLVEELRHASAIDRWFFVRYADPQFHLRVRLHAASGNAAFVREAFLRAAEGWLREGLVLRCGLETYAPEFERYGGVDGCARAEDFFTHDSDVCARVLADSFDGTDELVEAAARSFYSFLSANGELPVSACDAFAFAGHRKVNDADRKALRLFASVQANPAGARSLLSAMDAGEGPKSLRDFAHMHCNRLGLDGDLEDRVFLLLRNAIRRPG